MKIGTIYIGTSGWQYKHWNGSFYPPGTSQQKQFVEYAKSFKSVELNNPFYKLPLRDTFRKWKQQAPDDFLYAVKASRYITHMKKLRDTDEAIRLFVHNAGGLGKKLGPILFQLPPKWNINVDRFQHFLSTLPKRHRYVFEFRNVTWYDDRIYELLRKKNCAFCQYELASHQSPSEVTANFVYVRLHGPGDKYQGSYADEVLEKLATRCRDWSNRGLDVFVYFDNDEAGYAAINARTLIGMVDR